MTAITRALLLSALLLATALTAACMEIGYGFEFREDTSGRFVVTFSMDKGTLDMLALSGEADPLLQFETDVPPGFTTERFEEGDRVGVRLIGEFQDLNDLRRKQGVNIGDMPAPTITADWSLLTGSFSFRQEFSAEDTFGGEAPSLEDLGLGGDGDLGELGLGAVPSLEEILTFFVTLTMPGTVTDHNADEVDGNTLTWKPNIFEAEQVIIEASWEATLPVESLEIDTTINSDGSAERLVSLRLPSSTQQTVEQTQGGDAIEGYLLDRVPQGTYSSRESGETTTHELSFQADSLTELAQLSAGLFGDDRISKEKGGGSLLKEKQLYSEQADFGGWLGQSSSLDAVTVRYTLPDDVASVDQEGATYEGRSVEVQIAKGDVLNITMETEATATGRLLLIVGGMVIVGGAGLIAVVLIVTLARRRAAA